MLPFTIQLIEKKVEIFYKNTYEDDQNRMDILPEVNSLVWTLEKWSSLFCICSDRRDQTCKPDPLESKRSEKKFV
jgi:hypothetical protein